MNQLSPEQSSVERNQPVDAQAIKCSPEIIQAAEDDVAQMTLQLEEAKDRLRMLIKQRSDSAPFQCVICGAGLHADDPRHVHYSYYRRNRVPFPAEKIPRSQKSSPNQK